MFEPVLFQVFGATRPDNMKQVIRQQVFGTGVYTLKAIDTNLGP